MKYWIFAVAALCLALGALWYAGVWKLNVSPEESPAPMEYRNTSFGFSFSYPGGEDGYVLVENVTTKRSFDPYLSLSLFNADEYEDFQQAIEPREGPPSLTVEVFSVEDYPTPVAFAVNHPLSNYTQGPGELSDVEIGGEAGVSFTWSGLYEGRTSVVLHEDRFYVWSVQALEPQGSMTVDYHALLETVSFE